VDLFFTAQPPPFTFWLDGRVVSLVVGGEGFELTAILEEEHPRR